MDYYKVKVKYDKVDEETGKDKTVIEEYIFQGVNFGDVETQAIFYFKENMNEFELTNIQRTKIQEAVQQCTEGIWFDVTTTFINIDEKGKEKKEKEKSICLAENNEAVLEAYKTKNSEVLIDWRITNITETKIIDLILIKQTEDE